MRQLIRYSLAALSLLAAAAPARAQRYDDDDNARWLEQCRNNWNSDRDRGRACEVRTVPVQLAGRALAIDGRENGGIRVQGWNGDSVRVTVMRDGHSFEAVLSKPRPKLPRLFRGSLPGRLQGRQ